MVRVDWILIALCGLGCAGRPAAPAPIASCAEPGEAATGSELQSLLQGAFRMRLPAGYHRWDSVAGQPDETWSGEGHGVVIFDRARLSNEQIESIKAWGCQKALADLTVYLRTARAGTMWSPTR